MGSGLAAGPAAPVAFRQGFHGHIFGRPEHRFVERERERREEVVSVLRPRPATGARPPAAEAAPEERIEDVPDVAEGKEIR